MKMIIPLLINAFVLLALTFYWGRPVFGKQPDYEIDKDEMKKYLVWKIFYMNPNDPRRLVPKIYGYGWTINFRKMSQIYIFTALIISNLTLATILLLNLKTVVGK